MGGARCVSLCVMDYFFARWCGLIRRLPAVFCMVLLAGFPSEAETPAVRGLAGVAPAFPALSFERPLFLTTPPGDAGHVVVLEQAGRVWRFPNRRDVTPGERTLMLDLPARRSGNEEGLLGLAFHPDYAENRQVFLHYSQAGSANRRSRAKQRGVIARFIADATDARIDPASERVLLEVDQPYRNHNGGMLAFGEDGMLYIGLGDGGSAGDPGNRAQDRGSLLGKILRIDVDRSGAGRAYGIPADNPFVGVRGARPEVYAYGLRNPWRFSFDRWARGGTGALWVGDVGQHKREEIAVVRAGENHGWRIREGFAAYKGRERPDPPAPLVDPVVDHGRDDAGSITGGYVYRGVRVPALSGCYVYGDYRTGNLFAFPVEREGPARPVVFAQVDNPASFGLDGEGEVYVCSFDGSIYRVTPAR